MARVIKPRCTVEEKTTICHKCEAVIGYTEYDKKYDIIEDNGDSFEVQRITCPACKKVIPVEVRIMTEDW